MIAPVRQPPAKPRRRSALSAARQAVAEALLDGDEQNNRRRLAFAKWRNWIVAGALLAATILLFLSIAGWSLDD